MPSEALRKVLRDLYLSSHEYGGVEPELNDMINLMGEVDPDFVGSLRQEGTDVLRTMRNPDRPITSPASSNVPGSTAPFGAEEARNEFWSNPRGVMDQFAVIDVAPENRPGGGLADLPLEAGSFPSQLANVSETLPIVGPFLDPFVRTENESRAPEDQSQVLNFTKGASEAFPIAAGAAAAGGAVGLGVVGSAALGGGVADVVLGGAPFVGGMTPEQNKKRLASIGISTATGGIGGKVSQYINKWAGNRALEAFKKLAIPGEATEVLTKEASKKTLDPLALASALTGGNVEGIAPHIQAAAKIAGQKSLTDAAKRQLGTQIKDITTSALNKDFAADLVLGAAQAEVTAQATEGRHATGMEFGMGMAQAGAVRGARGIHDANAISKAQGRLVDMQPKVAPEKIAKEILAADPEAKITIDGKPVKADKYPGFEDFSSQEDAAKAAFNKVITEGGSEQQAKDAARRAAFDFKKFELTLPVEEQKARQQARDEAKQRAAQAKEDEKRHKVLAAEKEKQEAEAKKQAEIAARATEKAKREADAEAAKAQRAIAKEADRKAKEAQKIADKATKEQEKIAARAAKEAERVAAKAAKAAEKTTAPTEDTPKTSAPADEVVKTGAKTIGFRPTTGVKDDPFAWGKPGYRWVGNVKPHEAEGGAHWKLHLNVGKENYDKVDHWIANNFDGHYKLLSGGESGSKDFTIYVGSKDKASELASRMESEIGDLLGSSDPAVAEGDLPFNGKVAGRFDAVKDKRTTHGFQSGTYGERGIPQSWERQKAMVQAHLARRANDPDSVKVWEYVQANHLKTVDRDLAEAYGEWYTGKQETPVLADPAPDEVTPVETIDVPKVEELTLERMTEKAFDEQYDDRELGADPDLKAMGEHPEFLTPKYLEKMVVKSEGAYDPAEFETPDLKKMLVDEQVEDIEHELAIGDSLEDMKSLFAKKADLRKYSKDPEGDYAKDSEEFARLAKIVAEERKAAVTEADKREVQDKIDFLMKEAQTFHENYLRRKEEVSPTSTKDKPSEVQPKPVELSDEQKAANISKGLQILFERHKRPELEALASEYKAISKDIPATFDDAAAVEAAGKFLSKYREARVAKKIKESVPGREDAKFEPSEEGKEILRKAAIREKALEESTQEVKKKTKKELKAEADRLLAESNNPGAAKIEDDRVKRLQELRAKKPEPVKKIDTAAIEKQMEDLQTRIDNLDENEFGDEWKTTRREEILDLIERGKSKKKAVQDALTDEEREFLDSYKEAVSEFKKDITEENKGRDSDDKMSKEDKAEALADKIEEWLDEHIEGEAADKSLEAQDVLEQEMARLTEQRDKKAATPERRKEKDPYSFRPLEDPYAGSPYRSRLWSALQKFKPDLKFGSIAEAKRAILGRGDVSQAEIDRTFAAMTGVEKPTVRDILEAFVRDNLVIQEVEGDFDTYGDSVSTPGTTNRRMINFRLPLEANNFASHYAPNNKQYKVFGNVRASAEAPDLGSADRYPESRTAFHVRISDMDLGNGRKALVIEEIQSDAAQDLVEGKGPDFPLSDPASRNRIAIERMIGLAIEHGYDSIVMAPPAEQSRRNESLGLDTYEYRGIRQDPDGILRFVDLYGQSRRRANNLPPELRAKLDALQPGEEYIFTDKEVGYGTNKKVEQNYKKVVFPTFESILKKFGMKPLSKKELTSRLGWGVEPSSMGDWDLAGPLRLKGDGTQDVEIPAVDSPAFRAAKELYDRMEKHREVNNRTPEIVKAEIALGEAEIALAEESDAYGASTYQELIGILAKKATGEAAAKIERVWGPFDEDMNSRFLGRGLIEQHMDAELFPELYALQRGVSEATFQLSEAKRFNKLNGLADGPIESVSLEQKMPYIGGDITPDVKAKFADHRTYLLRPDAGESVPAMKSQDAELNEFKKQVIKAESDAEFSAKGEKGMIAHFNKAVKEGKVSKEIADIVIPVIKKYGKNMSHVSLAFVDGLPGARGIHNSTRDTIMLATEKMTHEGVAAGLEEFFHSMEKILPMEAKIEVRNSYAKEFAAEKKSLEGALAWANANGRREMAKDIAGTLRWLAQAAKGDKPMGMPPIRDYYKFADASEYWASKMMDYEWDRMSGLTHPDDDSLMGRASSWFRNFTNEITDAVEVKFGEDGMKKEWLKLGRLKPRSNPDGSMLKDSVWFEDGSQIRKWADNFSLRPGDGIFGVKQKDLSPEVEEAMMRTTPSSLRPKGFAERYSQAIGAKATSDRKGATKTFLMTKLVDQYYYIKQWEEAVGKWFSAEAGEQKGLHPADSGLARMRTAELATALEEHALTEGQLRFDPEDGTFHAKEGRALKPIWSDAYHAGLEKQFKAYLYAKRTQGAYEQKGVVSKWSADAISEALEYGKLEVAPGKTLESLGSEVHEWMRSFLDIGEAAGIIDPDGRANWEEAYYIPFLLEEGLAKPLEEKGGRGVFTDSAHAPNFENEAYFSQVNSMAGLNEKFTKADPKIFKRDAQKEGMYHQDIFEGLTRMSKHLLSMSAKNSAAKKTLENFADPIYGGDIARRLTTEEFEKKGRGMRYLSVLENGKKVYYEIKDPEMYTMMTNFGADKYKKFSQHPIIKALLVNPSRLFSSFITRSPEFLGVNPLRDSMALWATGSVGDATSARDAMADAIRNAKDNYVDMGKTMIDFFGNEVTAMTKSPELMAMSAAGLAGAGYYGTEPGSMSRNIHREIKMENSPFRVINPVEWYKWMGKVAAVGELRTRRTKYDQVIKAGGTHAEAVQRSLDLINYSMKGNSELLGFFLDTVPFLKARMSGLYKLGRTLSTLPHADRATKQRVLAASVFHRTAMMALASSLMYMYNMTENKDRYESLDENQRDAYWHSWIGDYHIQIPKPFEIGALAGALPERMADLLTGEGTMGDFGDFMMRTLVNNFQLAQLPHTLVPIKEQLENKVGYTERPIVSPALAEMEPEAQYTASTSETARKLAELAPDNAPEWMRSPSRVQHLLDSYFATMGEYAVFATDTMLRATGQGNNLPAEPTDRLPGLNAVGRIVRKEPADRPRSTKYVASYYDFQRKLDRMNNTIMNYRKLGKYAKADQLEKKFNEDASTYYEGRGLSRYLSALSMQQRMVFEDANMSPQEKRKRIDKLRIESNEAIEKFEKRRRGK